VAGLAVRITYDPVADAATIYLANKIEQGAAPRSLMCDLEVLEGAVILLLSDDEQLVGIEVLGASHLLPAQVLDSAERPSPPI
jgi:uncharacterized protein YuzE